MADEAFDGMRNRLSFLRAPTQDGADSKRSGQSVGRPESQDDQLPETPFDAAFLTYFFIQIYVGQLIVQTAVGVWVLG